MLFFSSNDGTLILNTFGNYANTHAGVLSLSVADVTTGNLLLECGPHDVVMHVDRNRLFNGNLDLRVATEISHPVNNENNVKN